MENQDNPFSSPGQSPPPEALTEAAAYGAAAGAQDPTAPEPATAGVLEALESGLAASISGLTILDRELSFEGSGRVDFAGIDGDGRLVLVLLLDDHPDIASAEALDLAVIAGRHGDLLARHLDVLDRTAGQPARLVLVAESIAPRLRARLAMLRTGFELFELQSLNSMRGQKTYLVPVHTGQIDELAVVEKHQNLEIAPEEFLASLEAPARDGAEVLLARMQRMDSEFDVHFTHAGGRWSFNGRDFLRIDLRSDRLIGRVLPGGPPLVLEDTIAVESLVEEAFTAYVRLLGLFDDTEEVIEVSPPLGEPLLSPEEIAAFQE
ncbi:MAG: hypothetical protein ACI9D0_000140 [Bacteroidia bacterium]|jgi:hypothetical protein